MEKGISSDEFILKYLNNRKGFTSGEEIANVLKITRQALWKHIHGLIEKGYNISSTRQGYKLISFPDKLYPELIKLSLSTKFLGRKIYYTEVVGSTQDIAHSFGVKGEKEGLLVVSERQSKGRGRLHRRWFSPEGGLYFSFILRPKNILVEEIPQITLLTGLGVLEGIKQMTNIECLLKWPNDIILESKKLGGILCELDTEQDKINFVVVGVGLNINTKSLPQGGISLFLYTRKRFFRAQILRVILETIETLYLRVQREGFKFIRREWEKHSFLKGKWVKVDILGKVLEGLVVGIDERGYLLLRNRRGTVNSVSAGDIIEMKVNHK